MSFRRADALRGVRCAVALLLMVIPAWLRAQGTTLSESWVGSETELYLRALAVMEGPAVDVWAIRPFAPATLAVTAKVPGGEYVTESGVSPPYGAVNCKFCDCIVKFSDRVAEP